MIRLTRILRLLSWLLICPLSSCIDSKEEIWLNKTGGGKAHVSITIPTSIITLRGGEDGISRMVDQLLPPESSATDLRKSFTPTDKRTRIDVSFRFGSALRLKRAIDEAHESSGIPSSIRHIAGMTTFRREGLSLVTTRTMDFGKAIPGASLLSAQGENHQLTTTIHLPFRPSSHNATRSENDGRTLVWEKSLAGAMQAPLEQRIEYRAHSLWVLLLPLTGLALAVLLLRMRKRRNASKAGRISTENQSNCVSTSNR